MLVRDASGMLRKSRKRGKCGAVFSIARDGRWYCVRKRGEVEPSVCRRCEQRDWPGCGERE